MISALVTTQLEKYPQMKAQDIIKLIYQNEFGGGHMIDDPETSLKRLKDEAKQLKNNMLLYEEKAATVKNLSEYKDLPKGMKMKEISGKKENLHKYLGWIFNALRFLF